MIREVLSVSLLCRGGAAFGLFASLLGLGGCDRAESSPRGAGDSMAMPAAVAMADSTTAMSTAAGADSLTSMPYLLRRFQNATPNRPTQLADAADSREALVKRFLAALERRDTASLVRMRVSPSEFAHLYFPESIFMRPPYELDPAVVWMQINAASNTGLRRGLQRHGGRTVRFAGLACQPPQQHGASLLHGCDVRHIAAAGDTVPERMFGAIIERGGQFKFLSLENKL